MLAFLVAFRDFSALYHLVIKGSKKLCTDVIHSFESHLYNCTAFCAEDDLVKSAFVKQQQLFRDYIQELGKINIPLDPNNQRAVEEYTANLQTIRKK